MVALFRREPALLEGIADLTQQARNSFWTLAGLKLSQDHWSKQIAAIQVFFSTILAFFAQADGIVNENLVINVLPAVWDELPEVSDFYAFQLFDEGIHAATYSQFLVDYITVVRERTRLFNATATIPVVGHKAQWAMRWIESEDASFASRLVAFACVEGIFFSGSFASIYWAKKRGLLPGLCQANEYIARDEGLHLKLACLLYRFLRQPLSPAMVLQIVQEAVEIEKKFVDEALKVDLVGINAALMREHIEFIADKVLDMLGLPKHYFTENPLDFFDNISMESKTNFFEERVTQYSKGLGDRHDSGVGEELCAADFSVAV